MSGGLGFLVFWFLNRKPGRVGNVALSLLIKIPCLMVAASSLTLFPEAKAVRNKVLISTFVGVALERLKSSVDNAARTLSIDHWGIFCLSGGFLRNHGFVPVEKMYQMIGRS